jgi:hypothetical protein
MTNIAFPKMVHATAHHIRNTRRYLGTGMAGLVAEDGTLHS